MNNREVHGVSEFYNYPKTVTIINPIYFRSPTLFIACSKSGNSKNGLPLVIQSCPGVSKVFDTVLERRRLWAFIFM